MRSVKSTENDEILYLLIDGIKLLNDFCEHMMVA